MKTGLVTLMVLTSVNAFAEKVDMQSKDYIKHLSKSTTYIDMNLQEGTYQNSRRFFNGDWESLIPSCLVFEPHKLQNTPIEELKFSYDEYDFDFGVEYKVLDKNSNWLMSCKRINNSKDLGSVFDLSKTKKFAKNRKGEIEVIGLTDEKNPEAFILNKGVEELIPCEDVLLEDGKNGEIESGLYAFSNEMKEIVDVLAVGHKDAKVERTNLEIVIKPIQDLSSVRQSLEFSSGDTLFIKENDKKVKVVAAGETEIGGVRKILVRKNGKILAVDPGSLIKLKQ